MTGARPAQLRSLTGMRGIAAWFVVLYHIRLSIAGLPPAVRDVFAKGYLAVDFFFLLSGFVIWLSWSDRLRASGPAGIPTFLRKRVARIWPLHLVMLAVALGLALLLAAHGGADPAFPVDELPLHILLLQNWGFTDALAWNDPAWSISAELAAYLLFPLLVIAVDWRTLPTAALLAIGMALLSILPLAMGPSLGVDIPRFGLLRCLVEFATGTIVCALWLRWRDAPGLTVATGAFVLIGVATWAAGLPETIVVPALFAATLLLLALTDGRNGLGRGPLHYLGEISYATYLGHFIVWKAFKLAFVTDPAAVPVPSIALYLAVVLAGSILLYHRIERPAQAMIASFALNRPARRRVPPPARR